MRIRSLTHLIEVVAAVSQPREITVLGSSALLAHDPSLGELEQPLELSLDADLLVEPCNEQLAAVLHEAVGEGSLFQKEFGVYADIMRPQIDSTLPAGWRSRRIPLANINGAHCLDRYDVAVVKLTLGREKDLDLLSALIKRSLLDINVLRVHYQETPMEESRMFKAGRNLEQLIRRQENHD